MSLLSGILFIMLGLGTDGVPSLVQSRTPPATMMGLSNLPLSLSGYSYSIMKLGPLHFTRKGLSVASTAACLTFTVSSFSQLDSGFSFSFVSTCFSTRGKSCSDTRSHIFVKGLPKCEPLPDDHNT